ncbi:MAG: DUF1836 domain-containing protein [Angelakisella sp.]|jgi:hypothetical protein|nr:DUF1836 domain-containing protein [Angelakisella sp.]
MPQWKEQLRSLAQGMASAPRVCPEEIPDLEIYMDQLTTYLDRRLGFYNREADTPFVTKSMVNNYSKAKLLPPPLAKRYNCVHVMTLALVCQLKRLFTIQDLGKLLAPVSGEKETARLYCLFLEAQKEAFAKTPALAEELLSALEEEDPSKAKAALVTQLAVRAQRDLLLAERILDTIPAEEPGVKKKKQGG